MPKGAGANAESARLSGRVPSDISTDVTALHQSAVFMASRHSPTG